MFRRRVAAKRMHLSPRRRTYWFAGLSTSSIPDAHPRSTPSMRGVLGSATKCRVIQRNREHFDLIACVSSESTQDHVTTGEWECHS